MLVCANKMCWVLAVCGPAQVSESRSSRTRVMLNDDIDSDIPDIGHTLNIDQDGETSDELVHF